MPTYDNSAIAALDPGSTQPSGGGESNNRKKKVAILGGGVGAMSAAFALTEAPDWQDHYDITVYQMGWRLGGKGANSRNPVYGDRIEEHGLHIWFGFYDNAFTMMQYAYAECFRKGLTPGSPFRSWTDAFKQHNVLTAMEVVDGDWKSWPIDYPFTPGMPGMGQQELMTPSLYFRMLLTWVRGHLADLLKQSGRTASWASFLSLARLGYRAVEAGLSFIGNKNAAEDSGLVDKLTRVLDEFRSGVESAFKEDLKKDIDLRRKLELFDLILAMARGMIVDRILTRGFDSIDHLDVREWLGRHGCKSLDSSMIRGTYDLVFAYKNGKIDQPDLAAGTAVRTMLRILLTYKGAIVYKMQAGMGEIVFSPVYKMLQARGVKFKFFHKVANLGVGEDGASVDRIDIDIQAKLKAGLDEYNPLYTVHGIPCWPEQPFYEQLEDGDRLQAELEEAGRSFESCWWKKAEDKLTLRRGEDFDEVVLGIPLGSFPFIAREMMDANTRFREMVEKVPTVQTQAFQLWINRTIEEMGWLAKEPAVVGAYTEPIDTWADLSHLIGRENWPEQAGVKNIAYFCTAMECPDYSPLEDPEFPAQQKEIAKRNALDFLRTSTLPLWPNISDSETGGIDWSSLVDQWDREGEERFEAQYWRANVDPSERYVLSVKGSTPYRLRSDDSGFANVFLAGDWTYNGINLGCVEAAAVSGLMAGRAICGYSKVIFGEEPNTVPQKAPAIAVGAAK